MNVKNTITWYLARNYRGEFNSGQNCDGAPCWTDDLRYARFHDNIGPVKAHVTKHVKRHPNESIPEILEWTIDIATAKVIDVSGETNKRIERAAREKARRTEIERLEELEHIEEQRQALAERERKLRG